MWSDVDKEVWEVEENAATGVKMRVIDRFKNAGTVLASDAPIVVAESGMGARSGRCEASVPHAAKKTVNKTEEKGSFLNRKNIRGIKTAVAENAWANYRLSEEAEQVMLLARLNLYNRGLPCDGVALRRRLNEHYHLKPLPSSRRIGSILARNGLSYGRTGRHEGEKAEWLPHSAGSQMAERRGDILTQRAAH